MAAAAINRCWRHYQMLTQPAGGEPASSATERQIFLLTDDDNRTLAYLMRTADEAAVVALNRSDSKRRRSPSTLKGLLPDDVHHGRRAARGAVR